MNNYSVDDLRSLYVAAQDALVCLDDVVMAMPRSVRRDEIDNVAAKLSDALKRMDEVPF